MSVIFHSLPRNLLKCFEGRNLLWHLLAFTLTGIITITGFDWLYFQSSRSHLFQSLLWPAVRIGSRMPIVLPVVLSICGKAFKKYKLVIAAGGVGQSILIGLVVCTLYKAMTGRVHPPRMLTPYTVDVSREFRFGLLRGGVFWGWPSSHTTIAFAMAVTLLMLYPKNAIVKYLAVCYALYVGFGVSVSIHWFSDFIAGAIFGTVIGAVTGKSFREIAHA